MLTLSPLKLLIVVVVAVILVGPDKLPGVARQLGAGWGAFRKLRQRVEDELHDTVPDLPSAYDIARAVRSPVAFLDSLADRHEGTTPADGNAPEAIGTEDPVVAAGPIVEGPPAGAGPGAPGHLPEASLAAPGGLKVPDDPSMN